MECSPSKNSAMYSFKKGFHAPKGFTAEMVAKELAVIRSRCGLLTAEHVVSEARKGGLPALNSYFEWDDAKAGEQHRLRQARNIMACILTRTERDPHPTRAFLVVRPENSERQYMPGTIVYSDPDLFKDSFGRIMGHIKACVAEAQIMASNAPSDKKLHAIRVKNAAAKLLQTVQSI